MTDDSLARRVAELDAECDQLAKVNKDLRWQLDVNRKAYKDKVDHVLELRQLVVDMYEELDDKEAFEERVRPWRDGWDE